MQDPGPDHEDVPAVPNIVVILEASIPGIAEEPELRQYETGDLDGVLALLHDAMGWAVDDRHRELFTWKHALGPLGPSPAWVAVAEGRIVGLRTFVPWALERGGEPVRAVRAVDTAVHPDWQRRKVFSRLTRLALDALAAGGTDLVFNTPNAKSGPGYRKLGWELLGRLPVRARLGSAGAVARLLRSREAAARWSRPCDVGAPAQEVLGDTAAVTRLLASQPGSSRLRTQRSPEFLAWRYGFDPLGYRALLSGSKADDGIALFRLRQRGRAVEATLCEILVPGGEQKAIDTLASRVARATRADYALCLAGPGAPRTRFLSVPGQGPVLACLSLSGGTVPPRSDWQLTLGDVELL